MLTHVIDKFPAPGQPIELPATVKSIVAVLYRDAGRTTHDVDGLRLEGQNLFGNWPQDVHESANIRLVYIPNDEPAKKAKK